MSNVQLSRLASRSSDIVRFFNENKDPFVTLNYVYIYTLANGTGVIREALIAQHLDDPTSSSQLDFNSTFFPYLGSTPYETVSQTKVPYEALPNATIDASFPYGFRRGVQSCLTEV